MRTTRLITATLAAVTAAAALAGPAAAVPADAPHHQPRPWYAGESTVLGAAHSHAAQALRSQDLNDTGTVNATVPSTKALTAPPSRFDWASAAIGAAAVAALSLAIIGFAILRRRRLAAPGPLKTH